MGISEKKMQIVINNYFKQECSVNTSIREAFEKGFRIGIKKASSAQPEPSADVVPVVHGHWEYIDDTYCGFEDTDVRCSVCKTTTNIKRFRKTKWCPDCGAKMDREE